MWDPPEFEDDEQRPPMPAVPSPPPSEPSGAPLPPHVGPRPAAFDPPQSRPTAPHITSGDFLTPAPAKPSATPAAPTGLNRPTTLTDGRSPFDLAPESTGSPTPTASVPVPPASPGSVLIAPEGPEVPTPAAPPTPAGPTPRRRMWPLAFLAVLTVAASGALSWFVATRVDSNDVAVQPAEIAQDDGAVAQPAVADGTSPAPTPAPVDTSPPLSSFDEEPFAVAAKSIAPSVVQLNLGGSLGTGVIIDADGTILTAAHVVGNASDVRVTFFDGSSVDGTVVGAHGPTDVAVVQVDPEGRTLVPARLADGDAVQVGQLAVAVGSPFGFDQTVTAGIISAVDRVVNSVSMVQTDAPINPGNSGGPLINLAGEVVGINDLIFTESGSSAGVGFAISIDLAMIVADQIIAGDDVQLALLGVSTNPPLNGNAGAQVAEVVAGSAAEAAGLEVGDIVIGVDGDPTRGSSELRAQIIDNAPGTSIILEVMRSGEQLRVPVTLGQTG